MQNFDFYNPTRIIFGRGQTNRVGEVTKAYGKRVLLLYGRGSVKRIGLFEKVVRSLRQAGVGWIEYGGVRSNPVLGFARKAIDLFRREKLDAIVAVGGGSVIDTAKTVAAGVLYEGDAWDFFCNKAEVEKAVPVIVVLTLAASGSEMNGGGVITNEKTQQKLHLVGEPLFPKASILDPVNTYTAPIDHSMYGAVDAIMHVLEGYFNATDPATPLQDRFVEGLVKTVMENAKIIFYKPNDYEARANIMWCAALALNGLMVSGVAAEGFPMHMIEHSLSALYDIPHGAGLAIVAPSWMRYKSKSDPEKFAQFAKRVFNASDGSMQEKAAKGINSLEKWFLSIGVPVRLSDVDIPASDIKKIAENARMTAKLWGLTGYTVEIIEKILKKAA